MNYSTAVFLINKSVRAILCTYEAQENADRVVFKTLDPTIQPGDFVVVPTDSRHKMTVNKVVEVDVDFDIDTQKTVQWIIGRVDRTEFERTLANEQTAIQAIKKAELRKKRDDLGKNLLADYAADLNTLAIADGTDKAKAAE